MGSEVDEILVAYNPTAVSVEAQPELLEVRGGGGLGGAADPYYSDLSRALTEYVNHARASGGGARGGIVLEVEEGFWDARDPGPRGGAAIVPEAWLDPPPERTSPLPSTQARDPWVPAPVRLPQQAGPVENPREEERTDIREFIGSRPAAEVFLRAQIVRRPDDLPAEPTAELEGIAKFIRPIRREAATAPSSAEPAPVPAPAPAPEEQRAELAAAEARADNLADDEGFLLI